MSEELWLADLKVLDLSRLLPGPFCTLLLADMGADVLKIEEPGGSDYARFFPPMTPDGTMGAFYAGLNRNKRSMTLNLKKPEGVDILRRLVAEADVLVESFRPGVMARLGVGYQELREVNPGLIYCAISGYGQDGPMCARAGHDLNYMARAGLLEQNGAAGVAPAMPGFQVADIAGGTLYAAIGILGALHRRHRSGEGALVDISMTEGALSLHLPIHAAAAQGMAPRRGQEMLNGGLPCYNVYKTRDGKYLAVSALEPKFWAGFVDAIGAPDLLGVGMASGAAGEDARQQVARILAGKTRAEWVEVFARVDVCVEPVRAPDEVLADELFRARQVFFDLAGVHQTATPVTPRGRAHTPVAPLGAHTDAVLSELGLGDALDALRQGGVI